MAKWIARHGIVAEGFYVRSEHRLSADWVSRTNLDDILSWGDSVGCKRIPFKAIWNRFIADRKNQEDGWEPGPLMLGRKKPCFPGKRVQWNIAGGGLTRSAMDMGFSVEYIYQGHTSVVEWLGGTIS